MYVVLHLMGSTKSTDCAVILTSTPLNALSMLLCLHSWIIVTASYMNYQQHPPFPLQRIQNIAARLIVPAKFREHITPVPSLASH